MASKTASAVSSVLELIERDTYLLTDTQVGELALLYVSHQQAIEQVSGAYLKVFVAGIQVELGLKQPVLSAKPGKAPRHDEKEIQRQLAAIEIVHTRMYEAVSKAVITDELKDNPELPRGERGARALARNARTNFARSAASTVRTFVRNGGDIRQLVIKTLTKRGLQEAAASRSTVVSETVQLTKRAEGAGKRSMLAMKRLAQHDEALARSRIEALMTELGQLLITLGVDTTRDVRKAVEKCIPLEHGNGVFWPLIGNGNGTEATKQ